MFSQGQLRYFVTVSEEGQITRAAKRLHLAQPALSQAIAQLEAELGLELLVRHPRGVTLTDAGEAFLVKARAVLAAEAETAQTALALRRATSDAIAIGFVGPPPSLGCPELFGAFEQRHPHAQISFLDLPFPRGHTADWLAGVDIAFCHAPMVEPGICVQPVRVEPRALVAHCRHALAGYRQLAVSDVLDQTFVSYHPDVQPAWAAFHSLDDHRGGPPGQVTADHALSTLQMLGIMSSPGAITTVPYGDAKLASQVLPDIVALPLEGAAPAAVSLLWREDASNPLLEDLLDLAKRVARGEDEL
jgi:LysR family transcriptional regulator, benzoate and cis,cis-muconate-responsive activator of ben and cat genes